MNFPTLVVASLAAALLAATGLHAQPQVSPSPLPGNRLGAAFGAFGHLSLNFHSAEFATLPGIPSCCPRYETGTGIGPTIGLFYQFPIGDPFFLDLRAGLFGNSATLTTTEPTTVIVGNQTLDAEFEHVVQATLASIGAEPRLGLHLSGPLALQIGGRVGSVISSSFSQRETIVQPSDVGVFENGRRTRNDTAATIPNAAAAEAAVVAGISYQLPLNRQRTLWLQPEALVSIGLTDVAADADWRANAVRFGVAVKYHPPSTPLVADLPEPLPADPSPTTPAVPSDSLPGISAAIAAVGVGRDGAELPVASIRTEEFISTSLRPLLNYLFFDPNSATIPERYVQIPAEATGQFRIERLHNVGTLPTYYHLLNIVGKRMRQHPEATITITGCSPEMASGETGAEAGGTLARQRAEAVRHYLLSVWDIAPERIAIETRAMPATPSNPAEADGMEENRRAEITASIPEILEPVVTTDTIRTVNPPVIRLKPTVQATAGVLNWGITASQGGQPLRSFSGLGKPPATLDWNIEQEQATIPKGKGPLHFQLSTEDVAGGKAAATETLPVEQLTVQTKRTERIADREIDRYSLILFDFDRAELNAPNQRIGQFIRGRIGPEATVAITGYTDRIGEPEHNQRLSEERARATAQALGARPEQAVGRGETTTLFNNDLPEGRFYCRTVTVVVETPIR